MDFKEIIKRHLDQMAQQDSAFAERYKDEKKSLDECLKYITSQARKQAKGNCAAVEDAVVYGWAVHYYQEKDIKVDNSAPKAKVTTPTAKEEKPAANIKPIKAIVKSKENKNKCVELDLFGGF